jgi:AAA family ATP:ADP antiporter
MAVMIGAVQNILSKGAKYSLFDPTKEMAYIPLDQELKVKGKAAVDVIGGRLGKTGGGLIEFILLTVTGGSQLTIAPYLFGIIAFVSLIWMGAVKNLSKLYNAKVREKGK